MAVIAKFQCGLVSPEVRDFYNSKTQTVDKNKEAKRIKLFPVCGGGENYDWNQATPEGLMEMVITNPDAANQFGIGKKYLITIEETI